MKEEIKNYAKEIGVDDIGFASVENYISPNTPIKEIYTKAKIIIVLAFQQLDNCESENIQIASAGSKILSDFADSSTYKIARFLKQEFKATVISIPRMTPETGILKLVCLLQMFHYDMRLYCWFRMLW